MKELSQYFSGTAELSRIKKNQSLVDWFANLATEMDSLDYSNPILAGRKIATLKAALSEVEEFHQIDQSLQVKQFLMDTRDFLAKMIRTVNVSQKVLGDVDIISDMSYAWEVVNDYTPLIHERIRANPNTCLRLRATFLKLSSILSLPLVRISQAASADDVTVADYFSSELVAYVRGVLEVIPKTVFTILDQIIAILTNQLQPLATKIERKYLHDLSQLGLRSELARCTHQVSVFTQGILSMQTTLLGIIKLDPRQVLEDGIRCELVRQNTAAMHAHLVFNTGKLEEFESRVVELGRKLDGFKQAFEYIQDYISLYGLKIWQEEFSRIINYNVEQECNSFLKQKIFDWQSQYQNDFIPIPTFPPIISKTKNSSGYVSSGSTYTYPAFTFMGRLARELLFQTSPSTCVYVEAMQGWYDSSTGKEVVGIRTFSLLNRGVSIFGLTGLDKLIQFIIVKELTDFIKILRRTVNKRVQDFLAKLRDEFHPTSELPLEGLRLYAAAQEKTSKLWPAFLEFITKIGQSQLLRRQISNELNFTAKMESSILTSALSSVNDGLISCVRSHYNNPLTYVYPSNPILPSVGEYLECAGINNPITKIYITTEPIDGIPILLFLFTLSQIQKLQWHSKYCTLVAKEKGGSSMLDGAPLVVGVITVLKQFHSNHTHSFLQYCGQYVRTHISNLPNASKVTALPFEVTNMLLFLEEFCRFAHISRKAVEAVVPAYIFDRFTKPQTA